jgi:anti-sigma B factor antagonist
MAFDIRINGEHAKLVLSGDVDLQTTADLKADIQTLGGITHFEIDASNVTYIDSSGVAILLLARQYCAQNRITLSLPVISIAVKRVLEVARLDQLLPIGQIVGSTDSGVMGLGVDAAPIADDSDLVSELLASPLPGETNPPLDHAPLDHASIEDASIEDRMVDGFANETDTNTNIETDTGSWANLVDAPVDAPVDAVRVDAGQGAAAFQDDEINFTPIASDAAQVIIDDAGNGSGGDSGGDFGDDSGGDSADDARIISEITPGNFS